MSIRTLRPLRALEYSGPKNRILDTYQALLQRRQLGEISTADFRNEITKLNQLQIRYDADKARRAEKRAELREARKALEQAHTRAMRRQQKEQEMREAEQRIARQLEQMRREREERALKRKQRADAKKSMKTVLAEIIKPRAIPFERLSQWASIRIPDQPFTLTLKSGVANVKRHFNFHSREHFHNWMASIENQNTVKESANYRSYADVVGTDENVFNSVIPSIEEVRGGCRSRGKEHDTIETPFHSIQVYCPITNHNNCGFKVLEHLLAIKLNYAEERKRYSIPYDGMIQTETLYQIYKRHSHKILVIIDTTFDSSFDLKNYDYILVKDEHYYAVKSATVKEYKKQHNHGYLYWDIETRPTEKYVMVGNQKSFILEPTILCAYYKRYKSDSFQILTLVSNQHKNCCRQFLDWLTAEAMNKHCYHCIAHNGSRFDNYFLLSQLSREEQLHTETQLRGYSLIGMQYKSHLFKDSCCFLTNSLDNLCKSFKVKQAKLTEFLYQGQSLSNKNICFYKPELTFQQFMDLQENEPEFWELYVKYCEMDCVSLGEIWTSFKNQYDELINKIFETRPELKRHVQLMNTNTIGSLAKKILENSCLRRLGGGKYVKKQSYKSFLEFIQTEGVEDSEKIKFINEFKRGGISHTNQAGKHSHSLISYDIASQYPASMMYMLIPSGNSEWVTSYNKFKHGYYRLKNLKFSSPHTFKPIASKTETGVLNWNNETIDEVCVDSFMIKYLKEKYGLESFEVVKGLVSNHYIRGNEIFGDYVETLYNEKKRQDALKKKDDDAYNPALRECIKLFLNSLSGKLVEDPSRYFKIEYTGEESKLKLNGVNAIKKEENQKFNTWVSAGVMIYSYSKRLLFEYVRCLPNDSDDVIHIETDSIYFNKKNNQTFISNIKQYQQGGLDFYPIQIGDELGNVKVEKDTDAVSYFLGKKFYCIGDLYKIKGIPLKTIDEYGNDVELVNQQLYEDIYNGREIRKEFYTMKKTLYGEQTQISSHKMSRSIKPAMPYKHYE